MTDPRSGVRPDPPAWVADTVFYQVFPDRFAASASVPKYGALEPWDAPPTHTGFKGGDLVGLADRLDDLADLGISGIYLNPIFPAASNHRYNTYDYLRVDPLLGGDVALRRLLDEAHARDMRVILDGVFNHVGRGFWPFHHVMEVGVASPYRDWFYLDTRVRDGGLLPDGYPGRGDRTAEPDEEPHPWTGYEGWFGLPSLPKLRIEHEAVRTYLFEVAEHWLRFGADGWRLDVPQDITDPTFWPEFRHRCRAVRPDAYLVGEIWHEHPDWTCGDRFDALMNYPLGTSILSFVGGDTIDRAHTVCQGDYRWMVRPLDGAGFGARLERLISAVDPLVAGAQFNLLGSHDTPRARSVLGGRPELLRLAMAALLTLPGAPSIYYGDELGLEGGCDPGCRGAYPLTLSEGQAALRATVRALLHARRDHVALRRGSVEVAAAGERSIALWRGAEDDRALVALNPDAAEVRLTLGSDVGSRVATMAAIAIPGIPAGRLDGPAVELPPFGALILAE